MEDAILKAFSAASNQGMSVNQHPEASQTAENPFGEASDHQPLEHLIAGILRKGLRLEKAVAHHPRVEAGSDGLRLVPMLLPILPQPACAAQVIFLERPREIRVSASVSEIGCGPGHHLEVSVLWLSLQKKDGRIAIVPCVA